jgi:hypothetical protein
MLDNFTQKNFILVYKKSLLQNETGFVNFVLTIVRTINNGSDQL